MRRAVTATVLAVACTIGLVGFSPAAPALAATSCVQDVAGDSGGLNNEPETTRTARADVLQVCVEATSEALVFSLKTAEPVDPATDPGWTGTHGAVLHFQVEIDGADGYDDTFFYRAPGGEIVVEQASEGGCTGTGRYDRGRYVAEVAPSCLGRPASVRVAAYLTYPDDPADPGGANWYDFTELSEPVATGYDVMTRRLGGPDRYATAATIARATFPDGVRPLVARGDAFPDALAAANVDGAVLLTPFADLPRESAAVVREWRPAAVGVVGSTAVVSTRVERQLRELGTNTARISGRNRYETAAQSYYASYSSGKRVPREVYGLRTALLVSGERYADALSAAPLAAGASFPLLLTGRDALPPATQAALQHDGGSDTGIEQVIVVGGPQAVSNEVARQVEALGIQVQRVAGLNRQETAAFVFVFAERELSWTLNHVNLARGDAFADALAGGPHAGAEKAPILLTAGVGRLGSTTRDFLRSRRGTVASIDVFGGSSAVSDAVVAEARSAAIR